MAARRRSRLPRSRVVVVLFWWRGPSCTAIGDAFSAVRWEWVAAAIALNLASVVARALAWTDGDPPGDAAAASERHARLLGVLGRAVRERRAAGPDRRARARRRARRARCRGARGLVGDARRHRLRAPRLRPRARWCCSSSTSSRRRTSRLGDHEPARSSSASASRSSRSRSSSARAPARGVARRARRRAADRRDGPAGTRRDAHAGRRRRSPSSSSSLGWVCQLFAVWTAMRAFDIHAPLPAAALVLLLMNVATIFPLWPGNVGLVQVAIATPLEASYGVALRARRRVRLRAAGDRGVGRHRRRPDLPRARGALARDAAG